MLGQKRNINYQLSLFIAWWYRQTLKSIILEANCEGIYRALNLKIYTFYVGTFDLISILLNNISCNEKMFILMYILSACKHIKVTYCYETRRNIITSIQHGKTMVLRWRRIIHTYLNLRMLLPMHVEPIIFYRCFSYFGLVLLSYNSYASFELPLQHLCPQGFWRQYLKAV